MRNQLFHAVRYIRTLRFALIMCVQFYFVQVVLAGVAANNYRGEMNGWGNAAMVEDGGYWRCTIISAGDDSESNFKFDSVGDWSGQEWARGDVVSLATKETAYANPGSDAKFNESDGQYYTFTIKNVNEGVDADHCIQETANNPITFSRSGEESGGELAASEVNTITLTLSSGTHTENIYVRYTTNNWSTSSEVLASGVGITQTADIPSQSSGATVEYYAFSTTFGSVNSDHDLKTIKYDNDGYGNNSSYTTVTQPSVGHGSATLSFTMTRGAVPAPQTFSVTNNGGGTLTYTNTLTYGAGASGWLSTSIANSSLGASATESTTVSVTQSNLTAGTYYATNTITGNQTNGTKTVVIDITVSDVSNPSVSSIAVDATHPATRVDLDWTKNGDSHDVMIVRSDDASFTAPTDTTTYNVNDVINGDTVIYRGSATTFEDTGRLEGVTYYYKLYSEHYTYYSAGVETSVTTEYAETRNSSGGAVEDPSVTVYLGDTHEFGCDSWASIDGAFGKWRVVIDTDADLSDGAAGSYAGYLEVEHKTNTSARFTSVGTWYWGMQVEYGGTHGDDHWYVSDSGAWIDMAATPTSTLTVDVQALPVVTEQSATTNAVNPTNQIDLVWTPQATPAAGDYQVMIVRKSGSAPSAPTQGTSYSVSDACGGGTVVYKGFASSTTDSGLSAGTTYHYAFYSENYSYYSATAASNETTAGSSGPFVPKPTVFRFK